MAHNEFLQKVKEIKNIIASKNKELAQQEKVYDISQKEIKNLTKQLEDLLSVSIKDVPDTINKLIKETEDLIRDIDKDISELNKLLDSNDDN